MVVLLINYIRPTLNAVGKQCKIFLFSLQCLVTPYYTEALR